MNRGNRKGLIFYDARDRKRFIRILRETAEEYSVETLCGTLMGTHFHLIVVTPHANISAFMQQLEGRYADYVNWRHGFVGHLFQGPFTAVVIENDIHLFTAIAYVLSNPCAAGLCQRVEDWTWSTYAATAGLTPVPPYLSISWLQTLFPAESLEASQQLFVKCMADPDPVAAYLLAVDPTCEAAIRSYISDRVRQMARPFSLREVTRPPLNQLFPPDQTIHERNAAIRCAKAVHGYPLSEIAKVAGLHPGAVSKIFSKLRKESDHSDL